MELSKILSTLLNHGEVELFCNVNAVSPYGAAFRTGGVSARGTTIEEAVANLAIQVAEQCRSAARSRRSQAEEKEIEASKLESLLK